MDRRIDLSGANEQTKRKLILVHGKHADKLMCRISVENVSVEKMQQMQEQARKEAMLNVFVIQPKQLGLVEAATTAKAAAQDPDGTIISVLPPADGEEPMSDEEQQQYKEVEEVFKETGAQVINGVAETADYINKVGEGTLRVE